jgi:hypothetical protein
MIRERKNNMRKFSGVLWILVVLSLLCCPLYGTADITLTKSFSLDGSLVGTPAPTQFPASTPGPTSSAYSIGEAFTVRGGVKFGMSLAEVVAIETRNNAGEYQVISDNKILFDNVGSNENGKCLYIITGYDESAGTQSNSKQMIRFSGILEMNADNSEVYYIFRDDRLTGIVFDLGTSQRTILSAEAIRALYLAASQSLVDQFGLPAYTKDGGDLINPDSDMSAFVRQYNPDDIQISGQKEWYLSYHDERILVDTMYLEYYLITSFSYDFTGTIEDWSHVFVSYQYVSPSSVPQDIVPAPLP